MSFLQNLSSLFNRPKSDGVAKSPQKVSPKPKSKAKTKDSFLRDPKKSKFSKSKSQNRKTSAQDKAMAQQIIADARNKAREIIIESKDEAIKIKQKNDQDLNKKRQEIEKLQEQIYRSQADVDHKLGRVEEREAQVAELRKQLEAKKKDLDDVKQKQVEKLEKIATLSREEAKKLILKATEKKISSDLGKMIKDAEDEAQKEADDKARTILVESMRQAATDYVAEYTVSVVKIDDDDIKGRVIGREGRNIRTFEKVTGVDVDLDEEGVIRLSSFDSVRREVARVTLERLIKDGRIQPAKIEEFFSKATQDLDKIMYKAGEDLCHRVKVYNLPKEMIQMLGRFKYRYSYGQNMITHCIEVTKLGVSLAQEVGANTNVVRLGCLLHDIGKVITNEEGSHVDLGVNFCRKFNIPKPVLNAIAEHHEDVPFSSVESVLVYISDAISGARPGARYADFDGFVLRMQELEDIAKSFDGVKKAYAIQAGREVRVIVDPESIDDGLTYKMASDIRDKIKNELTYPGTVKVNVIRELRASEIAK